MLKKIFAFAALVIVIALCVCIFKEVVKDTNNFYKVSHIDRKVSTYQTVKYYARRISNRLNDSDLETMAKRSIFYRSSAVASKVYDRAIGFNATTSLAGTENSEKNNEDVVLEISNGYLTTVLDHCDFDECIDKTIEFAKTLEENGVNFVYYNVPHKLDVNDPAYNEYYKDIYPSYYEEGESKILSALRKNNIDVLDFCDEVPDFRQNRLKYFFKTDSHWLPQTGLMASEILAFYLNTHYGYDFDMANFELSKYDDSEKIEMLGSLGRKVTTVYTDTEIMDVLKPKYETDLQVSIPSSHYNKKGKVDEVLFDYSAHTDNLYTSDVYEIYGLGNKDLVKIQNNLVNNGKHILFVKTSMANVITPFIAPGVEKLDVMDPRRYKGNIVKYIKDNNIDTVVMIYGTIAFTNKGAFRF